ncbi:hypothetical protein ABZ348_29490 [Streptomyces sp. NPDC005963]|uniref:hypothetical protein n=1 Tax=Streptomyces sp. NPDC005963 TaxID=3156721 RepID=UPI0033CFE475
MGDAERKVALGRLSGLLKGLYDEAKKASPTGLSYRQVGMALGVRGDKELGSWSSKLSAWLQGSTAPENQDLFMALVDHLESKLDRRPILRETWLSAFAAAQDERKRKVGGRPPRDPGSSTSPFRFRHTARDRRPPDLVGRDTDLERLASVLRARSVTPGYLSLVAPAWAGKSAFLASWVTSHVPEDTDVIAYFVRQGTAAQDSEDFVRTAVGQLALCAGKKAARGQDTPAALPALYEQATERSVERGRKLLLVIDGLDEDTGAGGAKPSIASLLPQRLCTGLTVLVGIRPYPPLPSDVPAGHPLRRAERIPGFRPSPEAVVLRDTAYEDLTRLCDDKAGPGREALGFLTVANRGGLGYEDLADLIATGGRAAPLPYDLERLLRNVAGRVLGPEDLAPDTFVLAHSTLHSTAQGLFGVRGLAALTARLDTWADNHRARGWPETTPAFLLQHYPELVRSRGDLKRFTDFTLDHRRLLRLADLGRPDLAITSLEEVVQARPTSAALASAAASRSLLAGGGRHVPVEVLRALASVGDIARTRSLALSAPDPASRALRLVEAVPTLLAAEPQPVEEARRLATEAAEWAERAHYQNPVGDRAVGRAGMVVAEVAVALAAAGLPRDADRLLRSVDFWRRDLAASAAEVASLLLDSEPHSANDLLDELLREAEYQEESPEGSLSCAREIRAAVAAADPARADARRQRPGQFSADVDAAEPEPAPPPTDATDRVEDTGDPLPEADGPNEYDELCEDARRLSELGDAPGLRLRVDRFMKRASVPGTPVAWLCHLGEHGLLATGSRDPLVAVHAWASASVASSRCPASALRCAETAAEAAGRASGDQSPLARSLVAQAFALAGAAERARAWAAPADDRRPLGRTGGVYRRTALAVKAVLAPQAMVTSPGPVAHDAFTADMFGALADHAAGAPTAARLAALENAARARLGAEPLMLAGLAVLQASLGDPERAYTTIADVPDSDARGVALAAVAGHLTGTPVLLDVTAEAGDWTLTILCTLARALCPAPSTAHPVVPEMVREALGTDTWYRVLPTLARVAPEAVDAVLGVVEQDRRRH